MTALTAARKIQRRGRWVEVYGFPVAAGAVIFAGALVQLKSGYAIPGKTGADSTEAGLLQTVGVAIQSVTGGAADGDKFIDVELAEWPMNNSTSGDLITRAEIGKVCYVVDDQTVAKTSNTNVRAIGGRITGVDSDGTVWGRFGPGLAA